MTISSTLNRATYSGNGVTTAFAVSFPFHAQTDLVVVSTNITSGVQTTKALTTDYTISGSTDPLGHYTTGGTVTFLVAPTSSERIGIYRDPVRTQLLDLQDASIFPAENLEAQLDYATMLIQRVQEMIQRSLRQPEGDGTNLSTIPSAATRANKYLTFDSSGNPTATDAASASGTSVLATGTTTARLLADRFAEWVNVKDFGALGNDAANDAAAIQAAITALGSNGGVVYFPRGTYQVGSVITVGDGVTLQGEGHIGHTTVAGASIIKATHSSGAVVKVTGSNVSLVKLVITSTTGRYTGASGSNYGVHVEGPDTASGSTKRFYANIRITNQPNHGLLMVNDIAASTLFQVDVDNVNGHGIHIAGGSFTGRTNTTRPGQVSLYNCRCSRTTGHSIAIGRSGTTANNDIPYRVLLDNFEAFYNATDVAVRFVDYNMYVFGDNIRVSDSAIAGYIEADAGATSVHGGIYVEGKYVRFINNRYVNCNPYIISVGNRATNTTEEIVVDGGYINSTDMGAAFYNPAITVDTAAKNVHVRMHTTNTDVSSLIPKTNTNWSVDYKDKFHLGQKLEVETSVVAPGLQIEETAMTLADDKAAYLSFTGIARGILSIGGNASGAKGALAHFRVGDGSAFVTIMASSGSGVVGTTGQLTGTTGTDTNLTISADTANNRLYIENRTGAQRVYTLALLGMENGPYLSTTLL